MSKIICLAALSLDNVIGIDNGLPWRLSSDLQRFKRLTMDNIVVMGRNTWESILPRTLRGKEPLPGRLKYVLTKRLLPTELNTEPILLTDTQAFIASLKSKWPTKTIYIIGGSQIYKVFEPYYDELDLTLVNTKIWGSGKDIDKTTHYFSVDLDKFTVQSTEDHAAFKGDDYDFTYKTFTRAVPGSWYTLGEGLNAPPFAEDREEETECR